jgi:hypothetical protein
VSDGLVGDAIFWARIIAVPTTSRRCPRIGPTARSAGEGLEDPARPGIHSMPGSWTPASSSSAKRFHLEEEANGWH